MQLPPLPRCLVTPTSKYSPRHLFLKHPKPAFLPQCQRTSFTTIQNCSPVCLLLLFKYRLQTVPAIHTVSLQAPHRMLNVFDSRTQDQLPRQFLSLFPHVIDKTTPQKAYHFKLIHNTPINQWLTQEFCSGGGLTNSVEDRGHREMRSGGGSPQLITN